jgi:large subunit ribosomal protein L2
MKLLKLKPITNGIRHQIKIQKNLLCKSNNLIKMLLQGSKSWSGRSSSTGRITVRHKGGGCKNVFRLVNLTNQFFFALVIGILYDPNRSVFISLNYNLLTHQFFHTSAVTNVMTGSLIICNDSVKELRLGYRLMLKNIPVGSLVSNVSYNYESCVKYIRSAGTYGQLLQKTKDFCKVKLPSGDFLNLLPVSYATIGTLTNINHNKIVLGKAGRSRHQGIRPSVRGIAMNPVDHPHGGRSNGGCHPMTPWGKPTRGKPTRK